MTDLDLALALTQINELQRLARAALEDELLDERANATTVLRLAAPMHRALETWISTRAIRAAFPPASI